jgi:hypothetical protein
MFKQYYVAEHKQRKVILLTVRNRMDAIKELEYMAKREGLNGIALVEYKWLGNKWVRFNIP